MTTNKAVYDIIETVATPFTDAVDLMVAVTASQQSGHDSHIVDLMVSAIE